MIIHGLVLCGGESQRMGRDKGLLQKDGRLWAQNVLELFNTIKLEGRLSINKSQRESYGSHYTENRLIFDSIDIPGPLRGILSAHIAFPQRNWLVMACDMIEMKPETMSHIIDLAKRNQEADYWVYRNEKFFEPFCGIYSANALKRLLNEYEIGSLTSFSLQRVLTHSKVVSCEIGDKKGSFRNFNQLSDLL